MKIAFPLRIVVVVLAFAGCVHAKEPMKLACVGASVTEGFGAPPGKSYPSQLQEMLGPDWQVGNFGVSGTTVSHRGDSPYVKQGAFKRAQDFQPNVVILLLGTNDTKPQNQLHKEDYEPDYRALVKTFLDLASKPKVYVCHLTPVNPGAPAGINEVAAKVESRTVDKIAREMNLPVIDMYAALDRHRTTLKDGVHPDAEGARELAKAAYRAITGKTPPLPAHGS